MHHILTKILAVLAALATLSVATPAPAQAATPAYFVMTDITRENFVVQLTDPVKIQHARDLISGTTTDRPHVLGRITKRPAPYNPRWSYQLNPDTISFFDLAIEVCDATIPYVEDHLDEAGGAFLPGLFWCPWTSRLVREIPAP
ncbi:calmodulin-binding protein [Nonomuraea sp. LP-02]|uniref:BP74-related protein n=1 Tax=Nonomuraea sp. LP-02 TaxID=3097960 RepID=UPI002E2EE5E6|nr:calmodulin-binding protein [Nonomuraea sp. LP-02]MED7929537.1 calmodulin-binding protein [Nonomuraea sp. LP-02]